MHGNDVSSTASIIGNSSEQDNRFKGKVREDCTRGREVNVCKQGPIRKVSRNELIQRLRQATLMIEGKELGSEPNALGIGSCLQNDA